MRLISGQKFSLNWPDHRSTGHPDDCCTGDCTCSVITDSSFSRHRDCSFWTDTGDVGLWDCIGERAVALHNGFAFLVRVEQGGESRIATAVRLAVVVVDRNRPHRVLLSSRQLTA